ncbi:HEAT repeat domain-containing protein [Bacillus coahuilensis]|uniref:HEAT repeat domain-containing protein n=1 Tax=Bacillus coahuilensis TaxID=408580 RepID=UPI00030940A5
MAIKISEYMRKEEFIPPLTTLMKDSSYYVRSQAAQALLRMKNGRELLKKICLTSDDAYARDMAGLWLERSSLA